MRKGEKYVVRIFSPPVFILVRYRCGKPAPYLSTPRTHYQCAVIPTNGVGVKGSELFVHIIEKRKVLSYLCISNGFDNQHDDG